MWKIPEQSDPRRVQAYLCRYVDNGRHLCRLDPCTGASGQLAGTYVTAAILWLYNIAGPITVALFTALFPYMVMTGMHMTLGAP